MRYKVMIGSYIMRPFVLSSVFRRGAEGEICWGGYTYSKSKGGVVEGVCPDMGYT